MKERLGHDHNRRELFAAACRYGVLGLLTGGGIGILSKRRRLIRQGKCIGSGVCDGCAILAGCELPAALSARDAINGGNNVR